MIFPIISVDMILQNVIDSNIITISLYQHSYDVLNLDLHKSIIRFIVQILE